MTYLGEGNGNPLHYSCLEYPLDTGVWWAAVHGVMQSRIQLKRPSMHACTGEGNGNPLQYSCLENPRGRGTWWAAVYGVAQSRTRLKRLSSSRNKIAGSYGKRMFNFIRNCQAVFQSGSTILCFYQQCIRITVAHIFFIAFFFLIWLIFLS